VWASLAALDGFGGWFVAPLSRLVEILTIRRVVLGFTLSGTFPLSAFVWFFWHADGVATLIPG
jgi:hypothetical protein